MGLLDFLSAGTTALATGVNAYDEGQAEAQETALERGIAAMRDKEERRRREEMDALNRKNILSQIEARSAPKPEEPETFTGQPFEGIGDGGRRGFYLRGSRGTVKPVEGVTPPEAAPRTGGAFVPLTAPDGTPSFFNPTSGETVAAPQGMRSPDRTERPTESQEKSLIFSRMISEAVPTIDRLAMSVNRDAISAALSPATAGLERLTGPGAVANRIPGMGENEQMLLNAARQFAAGILRKESGAAVTPSELREVFERFIPLGGDSPALAAQKMSNRKAMDATMRDISLSAEQYLSRVRALMPGANVSGMDAVSIAPTGPVAPPPDFAAWQEEQRRRRGRPQ